MSEEYAKVLKRDWDSLVEYAEELRALCGEAAQALEAHVGFDRERILIEKLKEASK